MKQIIFPVISSIIFCSCTTSNEKDPRQDSSGSQSDKKEIHPGVMSGSDNGWIMKASIYGKDYSAYSVWLVLGELKIVGF